MNISKLKQYSRLFSPSLGSSELKSVSKVFNENWVGLGSKVSEFENSWLKRTKAESVLAVNSATAGLHLALKNLKLKKNDEVLVPTMTFISTVSTVLYNECKPIFVDSEKDTPLMCVDDLKRKYNRKCKAIIVVHFGGELCDLHKILKFANEKGLYVIEDCAHSQRGYYRGKHIGLHGDVGVFSFEEKKGITTGDGGMIVSKHKNFSKDLIPLRWCGISKRQLINSFDTKSNNSQHWYYDINEVGFKYNMNNLAASVGLSQLKKLDYIADKKNQLINLYLKYLNLNPKVKTALNYKKANRKNSFWLFALIVNRRDDLIKFLTRKQIATGVHYTPIHQHNLFMKSKAECPNAETYYQKTVSLPLHPNLKESDIVYISKHVNSFYGK